MKPTISIICPIYKEEKYIAQCIESIVSQDYPKDNLEVFFVDGMSSDRTREIVSQYSEKYSFIHLLDNPDKIVPYAMNIGIQNAHGEFIIRLDAHAVFPENYFSKLIDYAVNLKADNIGGIIRTLPADNSTESMAIAVALSHSFGMGNSYFRIGSKNVRQVDTVPFGCFRKEIFDKIGLFDITLTRNQDDEFNGRIIKNGGKIFLVPEIVIKYFARDKITKVKKMFFQYGLFKPLVNKRLGAPATIRQFFPVLFTLGLIVGPFLSLLNNFSFYITLVILFFYSMLSLYFSIKESIKSKNFSILFYLPLVFFTIHVSYGWGYLIGMYKIITNQKIQVNTNR